VIAAAVGLFLFVGRAGRVRAAAPVGLSAPEFTLTDTAGAGHSLSQYKGKYVVIEWTNFGCPFVRKFYESGHMQTLQEKYTRRDVVWLTICSSAPGTFGYLAGAELTRAVAHAKLNATAFLIDSDGAVGRLYGAKATPQIFVIDPSGVTIYAGGIDSKPTLDSADITGATSYVARALDAALAGEDIRQPTGPIYGCAIKY